MRILISVFVGLAFYLFIIEYPALGDTPADGGIISNSANTPAQCEPSSQKQPEENENRFLKYLDIEVLRFDFREQRSLNRNEIDAQSTIRVKFKCNEELLKGLPIHPFHLFRLYLREKGADRWSLIEVRSAFNRILKKYGKTEDILKDQEIFNSWWLENEYLGNGKMFLENETLPVVFTRNIDTKSLIGKQIFSLRMDNIPLRDSTNGYKSKNGDELRIEIYSLSVPVKPHSLETPQECETNYHHDENEEDQDRKANGENKDDKIEDEILEDWAICIRALYTLGRLNTVPEIEDIIQLKVRDYGYHFGVSPSLLYATRTGSRDVQDFNISTKPPGIGQTLFFKYDGPAQNWLKDFLLNHVIPGLTISYLSLTDRAGTERTEFTPGFSWRLPLPIPFAPYEIKDKFRDHVQFFWGWYAVKTPVIGVVFSITAFELFKGNNAKN